MKKIIVISILLFATAAAIAQTIPFVVHHATGGPADLLTRLTVSQLINKNYIVLNKPGGLGIPAVSYLKNTTSILMASVSQIFVTNTLILGDKLSYDPNKDLQIIAVIASMPIALMCNTNAEIFNFDQFKNTSRPLTFGVGVYGSAEHLSTEYLMTKIKDNHRMIYYTQGGSEIGRAHV
jgi:tripartite-type tricarboxylate transporter receptor subunit TctC